MLCAVLALIPVLAMVCCELDVKDKWTRRKKKWKDKLSDVSCIFGWLLKSYGNELGQSRQNLNLAVVCYVYQTIGPEIAQDVVCYDAISEGTSCGMLCASDNKT